jgi:hypothetical protein
LVALASPRVRDSLGETVLVWERRSESVRVGLPRVVLAEVVGKTDKLPDADSEAVRAALALKLDVPRDTEVVADALELTLVETAAVIVAVEDLLLEGVMLAVSGLVSVSLIVSESVSLLDAEGTVEIVTEDDLLELVDGDIEGELEADWSFVAVPSETVGDGESDSVDVGITVPVPLVEIEPE